MIHAPATLRRTTRPALLVRAARAGVGQYRRETHLAPLMPSADVRRDPAGVIAGLAALEEAQEEARQDRAARYSPAEHVAVMIALLAEMRAYAAASRLN